MDDLLVNKYEKLLKWIEENNFVRLEPRKDGKTWYTMQGYIGEGIEYYTHEELIQKYVNYLNNIL